jgi:hypothetical protein
MTRLEASLVERLSKVKSPRDLHDWVDRDGYYVAACRVSADDVPPLIDLARRWADLDWPDSGDELDIDPDDAELLPVTAWRALADLKAEQAVQPLIDLLCAVDDQFDEFDDWSSEELPHVFGKIGQSAIEPLSHLARDERESEFVRLIAARGLGRVAAYHPRARDPIVACLAELMAKAVDEEAADDVEFNSTLLVELVELQAVEAAESIERAFAGDLLDVGVIGNWEDVRRTLGVEGLGLEMPENPQNSIEEFRAQRGVGIFTDRPIFEDGEIDHDAEQVYYERAWATFSESSEAQQVIDRFGGLGWFRSLLDFGVHYLGETVDGMTLGSVREYVLDYVPRKVSTDPDSAASIVYELVTFWEFLEREYKLPEAKSIVGWLKTEDLVSELEAELSDPSNFGMAKSFFMAGKNAGYDMTTQTGIDAFMPVYNHWLLSNQPRSNQPPRSSHRIRTSPRRNRFPWPGESGLAVTIPVRAEAGRSSRSAAADAGRRPGGTFWFWGNA